MPGKSYNSTNFYKHTFCIFNEVEIGAVESLKPNHKSNSGSIYYFTEDGVFRLSNHWGRAASCKWRLQKLPKSDSNRSKLGFAFYTAFHPDNDFEKLYYIESDSDNNISFNHEYNSKNTSGLLRTASETTKRIRQIRNIISNDSWTKYFPAPVIAKIRDQIIAQLIQTDKPLQRIKTEMRENL